MTLVVAAGEPFSPWFDVGQASAALGSTLTRCGDGDVRVAAPGVFGLDGRPLVVLPRCFAGQALSPRRTLAASLAMVQVLARYRRRTQRSVHDALESLALQSIGDVDEPLAQLEAALLLWADFQQHGPLRVSRRQVAQRIPGRVHWPRTVRRSFHVVAPDGNVTVADPWLFRHAMDPRDPLTELHVATCSEIGSMLGVAPGRPGTVTRTEAMSVLKRTEHEMFQDRHRAVHRLLQRFHRGRSGALTASRRDVHALYATSFAMVWERMLLETLRGRRPDLPRGSYVWTDGRVSKGAELLPDVVVDVDGGLLLIDAKHYDVHRLPGTESIGKQLLYRWLLSRESGHGQVPLAAIVNVFALPDVRPDEPIELAAVHGLQGEEAAHNPFGRVAVVAMDFERVAEAYVAERALAVPVFGSLLAAARRTTAEAVPGRTERRGADLTRRQARMAAGRLAWAGRTS